MKVYLARHGESAMGGDDSIRPLTLNGVTLIQKLAEFIYPLHITVETLLHSEKRRAAQTADILNTAIHATHMTTTSSLNPSSRVDELYLDILNERHDLFIVSHMPLLGCLAAGLVTGDFQKDLFYFKPGNLLCLERYSKKEWAVCWMLDPSLFFSLKRRP